MSKYNSGDYTGALQDTLTLRQHDPETASILLSGSVTPRDIYINGQNSDSRKQQHVWDMEAEARKISNEKDMELFKADLARKVANWSVEDKVAFAQRNPSFAGIVFGKSDGGSGTGRGKGESGLPGSVSTQQMNAAKEEIKAFDNWREMNPDVDVKTYPRYNQLNFAYQINDAALGYGGNGGSNTSFDWNDRNAVVAKAQEAIARRAKLGERFVYSKRKYGRWRDVQRAGAISKTK